MKWATASLEQRDPLKDGRIPSILIPLFFLVLLAVVSAAQYADYDLWWHLRNGSVVAQTGTLFTTDQYSWTFTGQQQFHGEWLGDLILYAAHRLGGFVGLYLLKFSLLLVTFFFLYRLLLTTTGEDIRSVFAAIVILVLVLFAIRFRLFIRPYLFSYCFFAAFLYLIDKYGRTKSHTILWILIGLELLWTNVSVGAFFGPMLMLLASLPRLRSLSHERPFILATAGVGLALLCNPMGPESLMIVLRSLKGEYATPVGEDQPLSIALLWGHGIRYTIAFQLLVLLGAASLFLRRGYRNLHHLGLFCCFLAASVLKVRMIDFFSLAVAMLAIGPLLRILDSLPSWLWDWPRTVAGAVGIVLTATSILVATSSTYAFGISVKQGVFPDAALRFLDEQMIGGRMMNSYSLGGYLIWNAPHRKVFIDGRHRHVYSGDFYNRYQKMMKNPEMWARMEQEWGFDYTVLEYDQRDRRFPLHLNDNPSWSLVFWDDRSAVYVKKNEANRSVIEDYGYRIARPAFYDFSYLDRLLHGRTGQELLPHLERDLRLNPENQEAALAKVYVLYSLGPAFRQQTARELDRIMTMSPDLAIKHSARAVLLVEQGRINEACKEIVRALELNPNDPAGLSLSGRIKQCGR